MYPLLHVDDMLIAGSNMEEMKKMQDRLSSDFETKDLVGAKRIIGMEITGDRPVPYANAARSIMYLIVCTRSDIAHAVSVVSRYLSCPGKEH